MKPATYNNAVHALCNILAILLFPLTVFSQKDTTISLTFDFNDHEIKEKDHKIDIKAVGASLTHDRFGNDGLALHIAGHANSYLNLGVSPLLKSPDITISLWVNLEKKVYAGTGPTVSPIVTIQNGPGEDYTNALAVGYDWASKRVAANSTKDSTEEVVIMAIDTMELNKWYHMVFVCNNKYMAFYVNGQLQGRLKKNFETQFLLSDSMVIGHSAGFKNNRFSQGVFDDIQIFHRSLSQQEVLDLYKAPNPNEFKRLLTASLKYVAIILGFTVIIIVLIIRNRQQLKKQKEELELVRRIAELELKAIKSQMNPHFISNSLAAIQELNYNQDKEKAGMYIAKFSYFLRQILNHSDENYISMSEELVMMKLFVELEQLRFNEGFSFDLIVEDHFDTEDIIIPSLITQPFIENAIWHGLLPLKNSRQPKLTVRIMMKNGFPIIEIEDNGVGRNPDIKRHRKSKGTQLVADKISALNRLAKTSNYSINIVDLVSDEGLKLGTKVMILLDNISE